MIISDVNLLAPTITLAVGIALGYAFRGLIAREERAAYDELMKFNDTLLARERSTAESVTKKMLQVEKAL